MQMKLRFYKKIVQKNKIKIFCFLYLDELKFIKKNGNTE